MANDELLLPILKAFAMHSLTTRYSKCLKFSVCVQQNSLSLLTNSSPVVPPIASSPPIVTDTPLHRDHVMTH